MADVYSCNPSMSITAGHDYATQLDACKPAAYINKASDNGANLSWHQCQKRKERKDDGVRRPIYRSLR